MRDSVELDGKVLAVLELNDVVTSSEGLTVKNSTGDERMQVSSKSFLGVGTAGWTTVVSAGGDVYLKLCGDGDDLSGTYESKRLFDIKAVQGVQPLMSKDAAWKLATTSAGDDCRKTLQEMIAESEERQVAHQLQAMALDGGAPDPRKAVHGGVAACSARERAYLLRRLAPEWELRIMSMDNGSSAKVRIARTAHIRELKQEIKRVRGEQYVELFQRLYRPGENQ